MNQSEYNAIARQLAQEAVAGFQEGGEYALLNLAGSSRLHNWVQVGSGSQSSLSTLDGEPVIVKVIVQLERPESNGKTD